MSSAPTSVHHTIIRASAGSGKTYRLAHRYIRLLSLGVEPDRILAVTFSRKAAGEIFESIVEYLIAAAGDEKQAALTATEIERPELTAGDFQDLLAMFLNNLHRVRVGTLDSFYATILQLFAFELGVAPQSRLIDTGGEDMLQLQTSVLEELSFDRQEDASILHDLEEAFKLATFGKEDQRFRDLFLGFLKGYLQLYRNAPEDERWGQVARIWPAGSPFGWAESLSDLSDSMLSRLDDFELSAKHREYLETWLALVKEYQRGQPLDAALMQLTERFLPWWQGEEAANQTRGKLILDGPQRQTAARIISALLQGSLEHAVLATRGLHQLVDRYHDRYMDQIRHRGSLSFDDVLQVLAPGDDNPKFSCRQEPDRLFIDFRLDSRIDHWLLDEFQDTSTPQYRVLENLLDEVYQTADGSRSVFLVGDVKQSIYGWRGGEFGLMNHILERYRERIDLKPLDETRRSCSAVLDLVNRTFGDVKTEKDGLGEAAEFWGKVWGEHRPAGAIADFEGYSAIVEPDCEGGDRKPDLVDQAELINDILLQVKPWERGLSTVILASSNSQLATLASYLREKGPRDVAIRLQGRAEPAIEPVYNLLLSLLQWVLHPGDIAAEQHLRMSPLWDLLPNGGSLNRRHANLYRELYENGLYKFFYEHGRELAAGAGEGGSKRWLDLLEFASEFMQDADANLDEFVRLARARSLSESSAGDGVHLMTIHQSKGLGFDLVFLVLGNSSQGGMDSVRSPCLTQSEFGVNNPDWLLMKPDGPVVEADPVLKAAQDKSRSTEFYEGLCKLYVATTRARYAFYAVTAYPSKSATSLTPANFLKERVLGTPNPIGTAAGHFGDTPSIRLWDSGREDWYELFPARPSRPRDVLQLPNALGGRPSTVPLPTRRNPSGMSTDKESAVNLFRTSVDDSLRFGTAFHELLEAFQWMDDDFESVSTSWKVTASWPEDLADAVIDEARTAWASDAWRRALTRPSDRADLWREAPFEIILGRDWVTGTFDRVVIDRDPSGRPVRAFIQDYKTNQGTDDAAIAKHVDHYRPQMAMYRRVLADMLKLDESAITCSLLLSKSGRVEDV